MQKTCIRSLEWENPLEKDMATHSSILAWEIPWTEEPGRLQPMVSQQVGHDLVTEQQQRGRVRRERGELVTHKAHSSAIVDELGVSIYSTGAIF